jgi:hypothetical protein
MPKKPKYYLNKKGEFVIDNYNLSKPFSSFFPGIAGQWGVPVWAFYVNRGQAIASFGIKDKDHPIMEFQPANKSYYLTPVLGFRTFIRTTQNKKDLFYDVFSSSLNNKFHKTENSMKITSAELSLKEINHTLGIETEIEYFTIPNDSYGGLARKVKFRNTGSQKRAFDILDGLPQIQPYGLNNMFLKQMSRTIEAWIMVENHNNGIPFMRLTVEPEDRPEIMHVKKGNFYMSFDAEGIIKPIVQSELIFGLQNDFTFPKAFLETKNFSVPIKQSVKSKTPCAFAFKRIELRPSEEYVIYTISGNISSIARLKAEVPRISSAAYFNCKQSENRKLIASIQNPVFTKSGSKEFDMYSAQNFLDNIMRGGYPSSIEHASGRTSVYMYSRKHGDLERDYNMFLIEPTYFSQGNGNYRDINQNRRCDIWFNPAIEMENIKGFFNLIQADGYNPLLVCPDRFDFNQDFTSLGNFFNRYNMNKIKLFLKNSFTPGELFDFMESEDVMSRDSRENLLKAVLENSTKHSHAVHCEGFWIDHWHYCLDLLESYIGLYPEKIKETLFDLKDFTFFDNAHIVQPRNKKYVLCNGRLRQFGSVVKDIDKEALIKERGQLPCTARTKNGKGDIYRVNLITKMIVVLINKFASLDPFGAGIEMESDKPNWYDSLNGLPGILGSSLCETFELKRWILFLKETAVKLKLGKEYTVNLPVEAYDFMSALDNACKQGFSDFDFWDKRSSLKEKYREKITFGFKGTEKRIKLKELNSALDRFLRVIDKGLRRSYDKKRKLYPSYFINEVASHKVVSRDEKNIYAKPLKFRQRMMPLFLEGMVHAFRVNQKQSLALDYHKAVRTSALFDKKLCMYKVCAPLEKMPEEIGRTRIFTPGWLENESIWLHMEYKYMLELLKAGLYSEFFEDFKNVFVPFLKPDVYGRSTLENSSFIVSSAFPEKELHGAGFIARLSGSTAEFINIWLMMCAGEKPFFLNDKNRLCAEFRPILPGWLFTKVKEADFKKNTFSFKFLDRTLVVYHNPLRKNTFGRSAAKVKRISMQYSDGQTIAQKSPLILAPYSYDLRNGKISRIDIELR